LGEFLAIFEVLKRLNDGALKSDKYDCIYSDSQTAIAWVKTKKIKTTLKYSPVTKKLLEKIQEASVWLKTHEINIPILKRETDIWGEIPADY
jgi:ribonuclease HI